MIKAILVEDEVKSLKALEIMLQAYKDIIQVEGAYASPLEALQAINRHPPNLLFLDIEMPKMNGFQLLEELKDISFNVVFTTAYDQFAIQAFKYSAVGYLLKPIDADDLRDAILKVQSAEIKKLLPAQMDILRQSILGTRSIKEQKIALPTSDGLLFAPMQDIVRCESESNYTKIFFTNRDKLIICKTLKEIEELLGEEHFLRVHQSHLINMNFIRQFMKADGGYLVLNDKTEIPISRSKRDLFIIKCNTYFSS